MKSKKTFGAAVLGEGAMGRVVDYAEMHKILHGAHHITMIDVTSAALTNATHKSIPKSLNPIVAATASKAITSHHDNCKFQQVLCDPHNLCTKLESEQDQLVFKVFSHKQDASEEIQANNQVRSILKDAIRYTTFHPLTGFKIETPNKPDRYILIYKRGGAPLLYAMNNSQLFQKLALHFDALHDTLMNLLSRMHKKGWLHCDIKLENILFTDPSTHPDFMKPKSQTKHTIGGGTLVQLFGTCAKPKASSSTSSRLITEFSVIDFGLAMSVATALDTIQKYPDSKGWGTYVCPLLWGSQYKTTMITEIRPFKHSDTHALYYMEGIKRTYWIFTHMRGWRPPLSMKEYLEILETEPSTKNLLAADWYSVLYLYSAIECAAVNKKNIALANRVRERMQQVKKKLLSITRSK